MLLKPSGKKANICIYNSTDSVYTKIESNFVLKYLPSEGHMTVEKIYNERGCIKK